MGMFCLDELHYESKSLSNIIGGAGTFAALGAGLHLAYKDRFKCGFILDEGYDFPPETHEEMMAWGLGIMVRKDVNRQTTVGWNQFVNNETRMFKYLTPKLRIEPQDLPSEAMSAKTLHLICSPLRCLDFLNHKPATQKVVWEPVPTECNVEQFPNLKRAVEHGIDILSPNALEAASFVGLPEPTNRFQIESLAAKHYDFVPVLVIRCGCLGSYLQTKDIKKWFYSYYPINSEEVVDPCGAGNAFCGGLGLGMALGLDWDQTMAMASVSSSFMIQQFGTPKYDKSSDLWNNESPQDRVEFYQKYVNNQ